MHPGCLERDGAVVRVTPFPPTAPLPGASSRGRADAAPGQPQAVWPPPRRQAQRRAGTGRSVLRALSPSGCSEERRSIIWEEGTGAFLSFFSENLPWPEGGRGGGSRTTVRCAPGRRRWRSPSRCATASDFHTHLFFSSLVLTRGYFSLLLARGGGRETLMAREEHLLVSSSTRSDWGSRIEPTT